VFVGIDENGVPRQASKRSTNSYGNSFRITCQGSDTRYSFAHFGESKRLYVFEAPIDMMSFLTLYPNDWQKHSCIAMNGVYENAVLTALKNHSNLREIVLCVDNDEGGIEAVDRLRDILHENGYPNVKRLAPEFKDWNECLKSQNGVEPLPAVPHKRKDEYLKEVSELGYLKCRPDKLTSQIYATFKNGQYKYLAEYALAGSAFFIDKSCEKDMFAKLRAKLKAEYKPYTDKGKIAAKQRNLWECVTAVMKDLRQTARTREQSVQTAKLLYSLADSALRLNVENTLSELTQEQSESEYIVSEPEQCMEFG
ncbi:toprim domain-containing protein, partial [Ruminococcus sp.]|uniref:toprim domain-containing protein n=1 Tax=Ruminococcus sp. TaxID=41978 RepID=UPI003AB4FD0C